MVSGSLFVGIDVSKARLDVALRPSGQTWSVTNDEAGIAELVSGPSKPVSNWLSLSPRAVWK